MTKFLDLNDSSNLYLLSGKGFNMRLSGRWSAGSYSTVY